MPKQRVLATRVPLELFCRFDQYGKKNQINKTRLMSDMLTEFLDSKNAPEADPRFYEELRNNEEAN